MIRVFGVLLLSLALAVPALAQSAGPANEALVVSFLARRQALLHDPATDPAELSKAIRAAMAEAERLERAQDYQAALDRLLELRRFGPLEALPSYDVHAMAAWLYRKLSDPAADDHAARAEALRVLLSKRIGGGQSPDDPVRVVMVGEVLEWARMQTARVVEAKPLIHQGRDLQLVTYQGPLTGNQPRTAWFQVAERTPSAAAARRASLFVPIPLAEMSPHFRAAFDQARDKRRRILDDPALSLPELSLLVDDSVKKAGALAVQGKYAEALEQLKAVEVLRPLDEVPTPELVSVHGVLAGHLGDFDKQTVLRQLLFGINQVIAHSGDGLSVETAVHVIMIREEYVWLNDKRLSRVGQTLVETPTGIFDVLRARDDTGAERDYYFNVTRLFRRFGQARPAPR